MLTVQTEDLLGRLRAGKIDPADMQAVEQMSAQELLADLDSYYLLRFQERRLGAKWEISAARSVGFELATWSAKGAVFPMVLIVPVFRRCIFASGEDDMITGISVAGRLKVRPIRKPIQGLAISTSAGFKLDRTVDGWHVKPTSKGTVKLTDEFLRKRGWRFDTLQQFVPKP